MGSCARSTAPPSSACPNENYFFKLSAFSDRLLEWYDANPDAVTPEAKRNEAIGLIKGGLRGHLDLPDVDQLGGAGAVGPRPRFLRLVRRAHQLHHRHRVRRPIRERFEAWWPAVHHLIGKDILRFHCVYWPALLMAAGVDPPARIAVHGYLLVGGEKMSKSSLTGIAPTDLTPTFGVDGFRYHLLRDQPFGPDGEFSYEGMVARYNADLANNLGNLLARVATVVEPQVRRDRPGPESRQPAWPRWRPRPTKLRPPRGTVSPRATRSRPPGGWCARPMPRWKRPNRGRPSRALPSTPSSAMHSRRCGSSPSWPVPP